MTMLETPMIYIRI